MFLIFGLNELNLVIIGAHNWLCEDGRKTMEVLKGGVFISNKSSFWTIFKVRFLPLSFACSYRNLTQAVSSENSCTAEYGKLALEDLWGVVFI